MVGGIAGGTQHLRKKQRKCYAVLNGVLDFTRVREISPLSTLSAEVSPMWLYVMIFSRLMATLCAQIFVPVSMCSQSDIALSLSWSFSAKILEILIVRFIYLCTENYAIDGDSLRECSRPYARSYGCICAYARLQSMMVCHTNRKTKLEIKTKRILDLAP